MDAQFVTFDASKLFAEMVSDHLFESYLNFHNAMQSFTKGCYLRVIHSNMLHKHPVQIAAEETQPIVADHTELFQEHFQGRNFDSFESLQESVRQFENLTGSRFVIRLCRLLKEDHELAGTVKYRSVTLGCTHGHTYELKPQRRTFTETRHSGCKARINVNLKQGRLIVTSACQEHNHLTIPAVFNRDLETQDAREYLDLVSTVKPSNYRLAKELGLLYGSQSSYQRVRRMQAYARQRKRANCQRKDRGRVSILLIFASLLRMP
ncbi:unnamed protein product [Dibothriocephalus latus]|uniref:ZSWIM3 N-terminal domain-containing protein n=1 Tax=Dibothriocephalus latus TaxID=60516 RepID=A0A3P7LRZ5_DIBLA|nr:unnamed protein product [Dibothriocephalus latus]